MPSTEPNQYSWQPVVASETYSPPALTTFDAPQQSVSVPYQPLTPPTLANEQTQDWYNIDSYINSDPNFDTPPRQHQYTYNTPRQYPQSLFTPPGEYIDDSYSAPRHSTLTDKSNQIMWAEIFNEKNKSWDGSISRWNAVSASDVDEYRPGYRRYRQSSQKNSHRPYKHY